MPEMPALPPGIPLYRNSAGDTVMSYTEEMTRAYAQAYAAAAVAAEREACAAEALKHTTHPDDPSNEVWQCAYNHVATEIAAAIRERK